jgi:hypothetical protein
MTHENIVSNIPDLTTGERQVLTACLDEASGNGYDFGCCISPWLTVPGMSAYQVNGTLGSLVIKGLILIDQEDMPNQFELSPSFRTLVEEAVSAG